MPISLDQALGSSALAPSPAAPPSGISLDSLYKNKPKPVQKPSHVGVDDLEKAGRATWDFLTNPAKNPLTRDWWNEFTSESNTALRGLKEDAKNLQAVPTGDVLGGWKAIGKGLLDLGTALATPLTTTGQVLVARPAKAVAAPLYNLTKTDPGDRELINNFIDEVVNVGSGFVGGDAGIAKDLEAPLAEMTARDRAMVTSGPRLKPRFKVVGVSASGKPVLRQVLPGGAAEAPKPVPTIDAASKIAVNSFDELAMKSKKAALAVAEQTAKTHPLLGKALEQRANAKADASFEEQVKTGVQSARYAATGWGDGIITFPSPGTKARFLRDLNKDKTPEPSAGTLEKHRPDYGSAVPPDLRDRPVAFEVVPGKSATGKPVFRVYKNEKNTSRPLAEFSDEASAQAYAGFSQRRAGSEEAGSSSLTPGSFHYLDALHARMLPDYAVHTANFEHNGIVQSAHKLLDTLAARARTTSNEYTARLIEKLRAVVPDMEVHFKRMLQDERGLDKPKVAGWYIHTKQGAQHIEVKFGRGSTKTLLHELVHAATVKFMESNPLHPAVKELDRLYRVAHDRMKAMPGYDPAPETQPYGMRNSKEFVAEAMSNPEFQNWLIYSEGFKAPKEGLRNLWSSYVGSLHKIFGIKSPEEAQLFHNTVRLTTHIMDLQAQGAVSTALEGAGKAASEAYRLADRGDAFRSLSNFSREKLGLGVVEGKIKEYSDFFLRNFAPEAMGVSARKAGATLAEAIAERVQSDVQHYTQGRTRRDFWLRNPGAAAQFINDFERGKEFTDPLLKSAANAYRAWGDAIVDQDKALGIEYDPVDHYMPHIFTDQQGIEDWLTRQFGTSWTKPGFTKDRRFNLILQAQKAGFKLKYTNPEDIFQARQQASNMARMKVNILNELERQGLAVTKEKGVKIPEFRALSKPSPNGKSYWVDQKALTLVDQALNSRSLWNMKGPVGDAFKGLMAMKNAMVPIRLAVSLFHPIHITTIHNVTGMVRASKELFSGKIGPVEWGARMAKEGTLVWSMIEDSTLGNRLMKVYSGKIPESELTDEDRFALQSITEGGLTPELSMVYRGRAMERFHDALVQRSAKALWHLPYAAIEKMQSLVFQKWIPQLKVASYLKDVQSALKTNPELWDNPDARRLAFRKLAKSVDNRYGEMSYSTLFWNRWVKDLAVANTLSLGWQLGFLREFGGAPIEVGRAIARPGEIGTKVKSGDLDRAMFTTHYLATTLGYGGLLTWALTGKSPSSLTDYIYPRTGEMNPDGSPKRVSTPFYTREIASIYDHMVQEGALDAVSDIVKSKAAGQIGLIAEWAYGINDFGQEIRDPEAPLYKKVEQTLAHTLIDLEPISVTGAAGKPGEDKALSFLGFTQAPKYATRSRGEAEIEQTYQKYYAPKETPFDKAQRSQDTQKLRQLYAENKDDEFDDGIDALADKYDLDASQVRQLVRSITSTKSSYQTMFQHFTVDQQRAALKRMTPQEREEYLPYSNRQHREELEEEFGDEQ